MKKIVRGIKAALLCAALAIVAWSATGPAAPAQASEVTCLYSGHTCHAQLPGSTEVHHLKAVKPAY